MTRTKNKFAKGLSVLLTVLLIWMALPGGLLDVKAAESDKTTLSINDGSIVIGDGTVSQNGNSLTYNANGYIITGSGTTTNTISVTGGSQDITLSGVNIDVSSEDNTCAFSITSGASVNLSLSGSNRLKSGSGRAGLEVLSGATVKIAGADENSLEASGGENGAGIGGIFKKSSGRIMIAGGTVTAHGGCDCAGIGSGGDTGIAGTIIISGGIVTASGSYAAGIGGYCDSGGNIIITGGMITATGGEYSAGIGSNYAEDGCNIEISGGTIHAIGGTGYTYFGGAGIGGGHSGDGGTVTISGGTVTAVGNGGGAGIGCSSTAEGETCDGGNVTISGGTVTATGGSGGAGIGTGLVKSGSCSGSAITISGGTVTATGGGGGADIGAGSGAAPCTTTIIGGSVNATSVTGGVTDGSGNTEHCVTVTGLTATADVNASVNGGKTFSCETDSSGQLYLWMANGDNKSTICCNGTYYGANAAVSDAGISTAAGAMTVLAISQEDITITDSGVTGKDSEGGDVSTANEYGYVISGTTTGHTISITGGTHSIVLESTDINVSGCAFSVSSNVSVYLTLSGKSTLNSGDFYAGLSLPDGASLAVTGADTDSLEATGGFAGAGIGGGKNCKCGELTINGGSVSATGGSGAAGIGGGWQASIDKIVITGGIVTAEGGYSAAGIGGGTLFGGGTILISGGIVTATGIGGAGIGGGALLNGSDLFGGGSSISITGGTIKAKSDAAEDIGCGDGIGNGYYNESTVSPNSSSIKISGGSVDVSSISGTPTSDGSTPVYPTTVTLPSGMDVSALSITQSSSYSYGFTDMQADSNGTLYLYLPAYTGDTAVSVTADGTAYNGYYGTVKASGTQANPNVLKMNQSTFSFKNTDKQTFTYGDTISLDTAVTGGTLNGTVSYVYSGKDMFGNTYSGSTTCPTNAGNGDYMITATLPGDACYYDATATKNFVINRKDISTSGVSVDVTSATYTGAALSPVITASFGSNTLVGGTDFEVYDGTGDTLNPTYTNASSYSLMIRGIGNYTGSVTRSYAIAQKAITLTLAASQSEAKAGGSVSLTATILNAVNLPAGTVTFKYGDTTIQSGVDITESTGKYTAQTTWSHLPAGEYTITAEYVPVVNDNYTCSAKAKIDNYSITKYDQTGFGFSAQTISKTFGNSDFTVTASSGQGGGAVTYQSDDDSIAAVTDDGTVTIKKAGTVTITAKKAADSTYNEALDTVTITIGKAASSTKTAPTASGDISVVGKLSSVALTGGEGSVAGTFSWTDPDTVVSEDGEFEVTFTPADSTDYSACTCKVKVKVTPVITDSGTGVQYDLSDAGLPDGVTSVSVHSSALSETGSGNSIYSVVGNLIAGSTSAASPSAIKIYSLSLLDQNGHALTGFTGKITVKIPIPGGMSGDLHVYWYNDQNGTLTDMNAKQENGYLVFETTHFSYYTVAELSAESGVDSGASSSDIPNNISSSSSSGTSSNSSFSSSSGSVSNPKTGGGSNPFLPAILFGGTLSGLVIIQEVKKYRRNSSNR